ncbi:hypothetical protein [Aestuariispira ectoiniformans]|uniref:hypothetical protein n=1 Tax=Aestuariispira ectoiniformans TaxID=2775080 RepID=UPI00223C1445|nr:hypothetical protein [Aestuariispira ectoiniformans]
MAKFAFIYRGGDSFENREEGQAHMARWLAWAESLGAAYIYPGMPFSRSVTVQASGVTEGSGAVPVSGFSVVEAETLDEAQGMAQSCPHLDIGGDIIVAEGIDIKI